MRESKYQKKVIERYESKGYYVIKLIKTNKNGIPDLVCIKPMSNGCCDVEFVEVKGEKTVVTELQKYRIKELYELGIKAKIDRFTPDRDQ